MAGGLQSGEDDELVETHEINVTPFIDVMLVLLIIFMVAAPLSTVDVAVDLPVSTAKAQPRPDRPVFVTIKADNSLALGNDPIAPGGRAGRCGGCRRAALGARTACAGPAGPIIRPMSDVTQLLESPRSRLARWAG